jgi:hypothetical protein
MNAIKISLLFLFMAVAPNASFAEQDRNAGPTDDEPECDYITSIETL